jgi:hypothetical protein
MKRFYTSDSMVMSTDTLITLDNGSVETAFVSSSTLASWSGLRPTRTTEAPAWAQTEAAACEKG